MKCKAREKLAAIRNAKIRAFLDENHELLRTTPLSDVSMEMFRLALALLNDRRRGYHLSQEEYELAFLILYDATMPAGGEDNGEREDVQSRDVVVEEEN